MSFLHLKNNTETNKIHSPVTRNQKEESVLNFKPNNKIFDSAKSSLMIGDGVMITGTIKSTSKVTIQGTIDGDIECDSLIINNSGKVKGKVKTESMTVDGRVEGEINISGVLMIRSGGFVSGKIFYKDIQIDEGGKLSGEINQSDKSKKQKEFKDWKTL